MLVQLIAILGDIIADVSGIQTMLADVWPQLPALQQAKLLLDLNEMHERLEVLHDSLALPEDDVPAVSGPCQEEPIG
jgi:hypothetical protein